MSIYQVINSIREAIEGMEDADLRHEAIDRCTDYRPALDWALGKYLDDKALEASQAERIRELQQRKKSTQSRQERMRGLIETLMKAAQDTSIRCTEATLTISKKKQGIIIDEARLPDEFFRIKKEPDRTAIHDAIDKDGWIPDGVTLDNGGTTLTIRT